MNKKIEAHVDTLFTNAPNGRYAPDIKEELLANLSDKYDDLVASGKNEDEAFALVISSIGDIDNLLRDLGETPEYQPLEIEKRRQMRGVFLSIGIALYVLSMIPIILADRIGDTIIGLVVMIVICAVATGFIVYGNNIGKVEYSKMDNSFVEAYKEKVAVDNNCAKLRNSISWAMWSLIVVIYFVFSFISGWWHVSWIVFPIGACAQQLIIYSFAGPGTRRGLWHGLLWTAAVILYLIISFTTWEWAYTWLIFIVTAAAEQIIRAVRLWKTTV